MGEGVSLSLFWGRGLDHTAASRTGPSPFLKDVAAASGRHYILEGGLTLHLAKTGRRQATFCEILAF